MKFELIDIILSLGIVQGLFLALALSKIKEQNRSANKVLVQLLLVTAFILTGRMLIAHQVAMNFFKWVSFVDCIIFLFGPLSYLYVRRVVVKSESEYSLSFWHYIPLIVCSGIFIYFNAVSVETRARLFQQGFVYWFFNGFEVIGLSGNIFYLVKNFRLLERYRKEEKKKLSNTQGFHRFLLIFLVTIAICLSFWIFSYINTYYFRRVYEYMSYDNIWITIPFLIYTVGYFSLKQPELFRIVQPEESKVSKGATKRLNDSETNALKSALENLLVKDAIYLESDLTLAKLSALLSASPNDVSWLLNNVYQMSFYDFINGYRVRAFLKRIHNNDHAKQTILSIAMEVGFNSKSTFNKVFKEQMGLTPSQYIKSLNNKPQIA